MKNVEFGLLLGTQSNSSVFFLKSVFCFRVYHNDDMS